MNAFKLSIAAPCSEQFDQFRKTSEGGYCGRCSKNVIDFSGWSDEKIARYFQQNKGNKVCGKFHLTQLKSYQFPVVNQHVALRAGFAAIGALILSTLLHQSVRAQETNIKTPTEQYDNRHEAPIKKNTRSVTVKGKIIDADSVAIPGASVVIRGIESGTTTDVNGNFVIVGDVPANAKFSVLISFIGYETAEIEFSGDSNGRDIGAYFLSNAYYELMGAVAVVEEPDGNLWTKIKNLFR